MALIRNASQCRSITINSDQCRIKASVIERNWSTLGSMPEVWSTLIGIGHWSRESCNVNFYMDVLSTNHKRAEMSGPACTPPLKYSNLSSNLNVCNVPYNIISTKENWRYTNNYLETLDQCSKPINDYQFCYELILGCQWLYLINTRILIGINRQWLALILGLLVYSGSIKVNNNNKS